MTEKKVYNIPRNPGINVLLIALIAGGLHGCEQASNDDEQRSKDPISTQQQKDAQSDLLKAEKQTSEDLQQKEKPHEEKIAKSQAMEKPNQVISGDKIDSGVLKPDTHQTIVSDSLKSGGNEPEMVVIPAGKYTMGSPTGEEGRNQDEGPQHKVTIAKPFALGRREVSVAEFSMFIDATGYRTEAETQGGCYYWTGTEWKQDPQKTWRSPGFEQDNRHPVVCISWNDASKYTEWLATQTGKPYRLPTEAEWEYAARANTTTSRFWSDKPGDACSFANVADETVKTTYRDWKAHECNDAYMFTAPGGSFKPNAYGLHDMAGNVSEWVADCWHDNYDSAPDDARVWQAAGDGNCDLRVNRGGYWLSGAKSLRSALRYWHYVTDRVNLIGFRLAQDLK